ncbi:protein TIC 21, chloroplastic-like [Olea europaea var. sylvestris]|uniref:protein TIC 21, chloroplastic-like n=1 Tax=Olea europaea var. sylvestris TaxID=158386 RepID=UPI000C1CD483|nr:protein TIC 21, chloroplastic-like [Olea europaea var. sylvestris]
MQTLLLPAARSGVAPPAPPFTARIAKTLPSYLHHPLISSNATPNLHSSLSSVKSLQFLSSPCLILKNHDRKTNASSPISAEFSSPSDDSEKVKLAQVSKRLESTSRYFKRLGGLGFWGQLVCTVVAAVILSFSVIVTGKITSPATFYATAGGIAAAFVSVFWSFGYIRLSDKLRKTANDPSKAPPRADVVRSLKNGIVVNLLGMGAAILGMQATVGLLVAKALTTSANPYYQGLSAGNSPVLALDVFLVQASANTILSHFLGLVFSLELLRSVTLPPSENVPVFKTA